MGPNIMTGVFMRTVKLGRICTLREDNHVNIKEEIGFKLPQAKVYQGSLATSRRWEEAKKHPLPQHSERA